MTTSPIVPRRRLPTHRQRLWTAMRVLKRFDIPTLLITAEVSRGTAEAYLNALCRAGYVRRATRSVPAKGVWSLYHVQRRSGPLAPSVSNKSVDGRSVIVVVDRNDGSRVDISPGAASLRRSSKTPPVDGGVG